jgi:cell division transport system permease protein
VDSIQNEATVLGNFYRLLDAASSAVALMALIALVAAIMLVANTIRLSAFNRRRETSIMRLVGASNFYIQLPFLLEGVFAGLLGWGIAAGLLVAVKSRLLGSLQQYFSYNVGLTLTDLVEVIVVAMGVGVLLTGVTSFLTLRRYLRV